MVSDLDSFERFASLLVLDNGERMRLEGFQREMLAPFFDGVRETVVSISKGSGKSTLLAALALHELLSDPACDGAVVAGSRDQAGILLAQLSGFVRRSPGLQRHVRMKLREASNPRTGGRFRVLASDVETLDGLICSFAVCDELHRWPSAERYTIMLAAVQKRDGRLLGISTAGLREEGLLWAMREKALSLGAERDGSRLALTAEHFAWREWSLADDHDPADLGAVKAANPASWITPELLRERYASPSMTGVDWRRFFANQWVSKAEAEAVIDPRKWIEAADPTAEPLPGGAVFALDASWDRSSAAIAVAAPLLDDRVLVDLVEHGSGTAWAVESLIDLCRRHDPIGVVVDAGGPAGALIPRLEEFGLPLIGPTSRDVAAACGLLYDAVEAGTLAHRNVEGLNVSVQGSVKRSLAQAWALDRRKALSDPAPMLAATLALWGLRTHGPLSERAVESRFGGER